MGAINNAFNQAAGAVAGSAVAIKHTKEVELSKMQSADNAALVARNQAKEADAEKYAAKAKMEGPGGINEQIDEAVEKSEKAAHRAGVARAINEVYPSPMNKGKAEKRTKEFKATQKALTFLRNSIKEENDVIKRAIEQRAHARKLTAIAYREKKRYKSRWGGIE